MERALTGQTAAIDVESGGLETGPSGVPIGRDRARDMVVNCVLPFLHASASLSRDDRLTASCLQAYSRFPRLQENELTREMMRQLFPDLAGVPGFGWFRRRFWFVGHDQFHGPEAASRPLES